MEDKRGQEAAGCAGIEGREREIGEGRHGQAGNRGKDRVDARQRMILAEAAIGFSRILRREQVIRDGDDGEENKDEEDHGDQLPVPKHGNRGSNEEPHSENDGGDQGPGEIEGQLHSWADFTSARGRNDQQGDLCGISRGE